ncbi:MAG: hypothetical protein QM775_03345 [Pirellulales bacterium]
MAEAWGAVVWGELHLSSLWLFSGLHKLFSADYFKTVAPWIWSGLFPTADLAAAANQAQSLAAAIALAEILIGCLIWWRPARGWLRASP